MENLTELTLDDFLDRVAERAPTPGGGSVAAAVGALACNLGRMVAAYSSPKGAAAEGPVAGMTVRLRRVDAILRELVTQDAAVYAAMTAARKAAKNDPSAKPAFQDSVLSGVAVPMQVAAASSEALTIMEELKDHANPHLLSDLGVAAVLAEAAARAARYMVAVNLPELDDPSRRERLRRDVDQIVAQCEARRASIEAFVNGRLENPPKLGR